MKKAMLILCILVLAGTGFSNFLTAADSPEETKNLAAFKTFFDEVWGKKDLAVAEKLIDPACIFYVNGEVTQKTGPDTIKHALAQNVRNFPDFTMKIEELFAKNDKVVAFYRFEGVHVMLKKPVILHASLITQFKSGKMVKSWTFDNQWLIFKQLGFKLKPSQEFIELKKKLESEKAKAQQKEPAKK